MKTLTISQVMKAPGLLKKELEKGQVRLIWKEPKPNGLIVFSAIVKKEES
jgi:hypothetical protein